MFPQILGFCYGVRIYFCLCLFFPVSLYFSLSDYNISFFSFCLRIITTVMYHRQPCLFGVIDSFSSLILYFSLDGKGFVIVLLNKFSMLLVYISSPKISSSSAKILRFGLLFFTPHFLQLGIFMLPLHFIEIISFNSISMPDILSPTSYSHIPEDT